MIFLKTEEEIALMREANQLVGQTLGELAKWVQPGITTKRLDEIAEQFIRDHHGVPNFKGYGGFPGTLCIEVNDVVVHGFPSDYVLKDGDIVGLDCGALLNGFNGDSCYTFPVGEVDEEAMKLLKTTKESLYIGIEQAKAGNRIGHIGFAVQDYCEKRGYTVVRELTGHGIGKHVHEDPDVPNYGKRGVGPLLRAGMCICIEPMINIGSKNVTCDRNGWTIRTRDHARSAHYEHCIAILPEGNEILSSFDYIKEVLGERFI
jgi:methionyl aminopeptidase